MNKVYPFLFLFLLIATFSSCESNDNSSNSGPNDETFSQNFGNSVNRDFIGQVVDTDNNPLQGVAIKIGSITVQTDINGVFIINGAEVYERFAYIIAKKVGYIEGSRSMIPTSGKNNVKIMLIPYTPLQTIQSGVNSEVALSNGTKVVFDGAFQEENGNNYSGSVQVAIFNLLPSDDNISKLMPGMLYAQTETNEQAVLETFGMINVELRGSAGQKLNLKNGHTADITMRIDDSQLATAPNTIPLWHFDEERGYWKEEGVATKVGNKYVGEVSHFSWWNCDFPYSVISLTVKVVDPNGTPISNVGIGLLMNGMAFPVMGFTNEDGIATGFIPPNQTLNMEIYSDFFTCNTSNVIYSASIGPFNADTILPDIVITPTTNTLISEVRGKLLKCDNTNVTNGYVMLIRNGSTSISYVTNGAFNFLEIYCSNDTQFYLAGMDFESFQPTDAIAYNFTSPITIIGNLQTCNTVEEFISLQIDDQLPIIYTNSQVYGNGSASPLATSLSVAGNNGDLFFGINGNQILVGTYNTDLFRIQATFGTVDSSVQNTMQFNLNNYGAIGEHIDMTFSGSYYIQTLGFHTISGVVHVIRDY